MAKRALECEWKAPPDREYEEAMEHAAAVVARLHTRLRRLGPAWTISGPRIGREGFCLRLWVGSPSPVPRAEHIVCGSLAEARTLLPGGLIRTAAPASWHSSAVETWVSPGSPLLCALGQEEPIFLDGGLLRDLMVACDLPGLQGDAGLV